MASKQVIIPGFFGGISQGRASDLLSLSDCPRMLNFTVADGVAQKRTGYATMAGANYAGIFRHGHHYQDVVTASKRFVGLTSTKCLIKETLAGDWTDKTNSMQIQSGEDCFFTTTEVNDLSDYKTYLMVCQNHTNPLTALNGTLSTNESVVWYMDSPTSNLTALAGGDGYNDSDTSHRAKCVVGFGDKLNLFNTYEETAAATWRSLFNRHRWSDTGAFSAAAEWDDTDTSIAAGYQDLWRGGGAILAADVLRNTLYIFQERGITACMNTNVVLDPYQHELRVAGLGLYGPRYLTRYRNAFYFVGNDRQIYMYDGGTMPIEIGDDIRPEFFENINTGGTGDYLYRHRGFAFTLTDDQAVGFAIPTSTAYPDTIYMYYPRRGKWYKWTLGCTNITGWAEWQNALSETANTLGIFGNSSSKLFKWDMTSGNDKNAGDTDTAAISSWIETPDIIVDLSAQQRGLAVYFQASGDGAASSVSVSASTNGGSSYGTARSVTLGTTFDTYKVSFASTSAKMWRFKFVNSTASQKLRLRRVQIELENNRE